MRVRVFGKFVEDNIIVETSFFRVSTVSTDK